MTDSLHVRTLFTIISYLQVFTGAIPFSEKKPTAAMFDIISGARPPRPTHPTFTAELWTLMQNCWNHDPRLRPTASEVLSVLRGP
jgi:hypothetical protein